ncbi:MAG: peptidase domain-containing ABC transporter [Bacteroidaceae bacterium]
MMNKREFIDNVKSLLRRFPCYFQYDQMDCGPATLAAIASYYGKKYSIQELREYCHLSKDGVSLLGIEDAAKDIGFETLAIRGSVKQLIDKKPLPCILHWDNCHFVVLYNIKKGKFDNKNHFYISDPTFGLIELSQKQFCQHWSASDGKGVGLLLTPGKTFKERQPHKIPKIMRKNIAKMLSNFKKEYQILFWGMLFSSIFAMFFPFITQSLVDIGIAKKNINFIFIFLLAQIFLFLGSTVIEVIRNWVLLYSNSLIDIEIISNFLSKIIKLPFKFFDTKQLGDFTSRIHDHNRIQNFLTSESVTVIFSFFTFAVYFILLTYYNTDIFLIYIGITVISILWSIYFVSKEKKLDYSRFRVQRDNQQDIFELVNGIADIKLNGTEQYKLGRWRDSQIQLFNIDFKTLRINQLQSIGYAAFNKLKDIIVIFIAAHEVILNNMTVGTLLAISYIIGTLNEPIQQIIEFIRSLQYAKLSYDRLVEVQVMKDEDFSTKVNLQKIPTDSSKAIHLNHVEFQYYGPRSPKVLEDICFNIPFGKTTAIVGESGSGKTTLMKVLLKFYNNYSGDIFYDGINQKDISARSLRDCCGVVMQDGYIFSDTLEKNIATGAEPVNKDILTCAIHIAELEDFVKSLPHGFNTMLGAGGNGISGGQRQRILIARAVYKNPNFILFDEATSSLDAQNERKIYDNLDTFLKGKTVVKIAHRLSTVKNADQIIVLSKGCIIEKGTHVELIKKHGPYYNLVKNQLELSN